MPAGVAGMAWFLLLWDAATVALGGRCHGVQRECRRRWRPLWAESVEFLGEGLAYTDTSRGETVIGGSKSRGLRGMLTFDGATAHCQLLHTH
jgi:hypothetical protein